MQDYNSYETRVKIKCKVFKIYLKSALAVFLSKSLILFNWLFSELQPHRSRSDNEVSEAHPEQIHQQQFQHGLMERLMAMSSLLANLQVLQGGRYNAGAQYTCTPE